MDKVQINYFTHYLHQSSKLERTRAKIKWLLPNPAPWGYNQRIKITNLCQREQNDKKKIFKIKYYNILNKRMELKN